MIIFDNPRVPDDSPLGEFIRSQRELHAMTMRRLAELAGISSPYLSQIEHGLREPSERVLEAIATNLEVSADALREHMQRGEEDDEDEPPVVAAIKADRNLNARQRQTLIEIYDSFTDRA